MISRKLIVLASLFTLSACGSSGGDSSSPPPPPPPPPPPANVAPSVDAGTDASITLPVDSVDLDGTVTDDGLPAGAVLTTTWSVQSGPAGASFVDASAVDTTVTFTTDGTYVLELTANDSALESSDTVTVVVSAAVNTAPTADAQSVSTDEDTPLAITLTGSDAEGDALTFAIGTGPSNGALSGTAPSVTYTPNADFNGSDSFTFTVNDGALDSAEATISITVNPVNDAPTADAQNVSTVENTPLAITLTGSDPETDPITIFAIATDPANGTLSGTPPDVTYTPGLNFTGADSFTFTVNDGAVDSAEATVSITVTEPAAVRAFWKFEEGSGTVAADEFGVSNGTVVGATWVSGAEGSGLDFDGSSSHVVIDNTADLDITGTEITMMAWIKPRDGGSADGAQIISKRTDAAGSEVYGMIAQDYRFRFRLDGIDMVSSHIFVVNDWTHVAMVYDGTDKRIYVNGQLDVATPQLKSDLIDSSSRAVHIGKREEEAQFFNGEIDEVQIFNSALTQPEVNAQYLAVTPPAPEPGTFHPFVDVTQSAGLAPYTDGGHGVMFADANGDSRPDLYLTTINTDGVAREDFFFRNTTPLPTGAIDFVEDGFDAGIQDFDDGGSHGAVWADLDNDGDYDLFNGSTWTNANPSPGNPVSNNVYRNDLIGGAGFGFTDVTPADVASTAKETRAVTAFDMDGDNYLDLYGTTGTAGDTEAYLNNTGLVFNTYAGGQLTTAPAMEGMTATDFDGDGDVDILAADQTGGRLVILQNTAGNFSLLSAGGLGITNSAFTGVTTGDIDNDGDLDILVVRDGSADLFVRDSGTGLYSRSQSFSDIEGYMGGFADIDNDGDLDLVFAGDERIFMNRDQATGFFQSAQSVEVPEIADPRSIAFSDFDNDGDVDFVVSARLSRNYVIRNDLSNDPFPPNYLKVRLVSPQCQAGAFGAMTRVYRNGQAGNPAAFLGMRESTGNTGYLAQNDPVLHFGIGNETAVDVVVTWADGTTAIESAVPANGTKLIDACP